MSEQKAHAMTGTDASWYDGWDISTEKKEKYSQLSKSSYQAKLKAVTENKIGYYQEINSPRFNPDVLMPRLNPNGLRTLSLFSGGGGLDLGFDLAGFSHVASYEILDFAANTLKLNRPLWNILTGNDGDVTNVDWKKYKGEVDVIHGGPPCQPFSTAGKQKGNNDDRDMIPEFVRCVKEIEPKAFVAENVSGLTSKKFKFYLEETLFSPLSKDYNIQMFILNAAGFGVPQIRKRVIFVGIKKTTTSIPYKQPKELFDYSHLKRNTNGNNVMPTPSLFDDLEILKEKCMGVREALGLAPTGYDTIAPTIRCTLTGPRSTTSILSSTSAQKVWKSIDIWPNGVQESREKASAFETKDGTFRLSVNDCALLQGFPNDWKFTGPVYKALGQIGNSVAPPMAYNIAKSIAQVLRD
jgi:DNA (cytosine-5)-methyltransferase 1